MSYDELLTTFGRFGLAILVGILLGLERESRQEQNATPGLRDFVLIALLGAFSSYLASQYDAPWFIALGFLGFMTILVAGYWARGPRSHGYTSELAALMTFFLGVLILRGSVELAIALAIATLGALFPKAAVKHWSSRISRDELRAAVLFLAISFVILPVLPNQTLDHLMTFDAGVVSDVDTEAARVTLETRIDAVGGQRLEIYAPGWEHRGSIIVDRVDDRGVSGHYVGGTPELLSAGQEVRARLDIGPLYVALGALNPYRVWLIVVLVSFVSFLGYVLIKTVGSRSGIGLTGLIGGLVSSTVTTLSFARRSLENPLSIPLFAAAIVLASSIMFPRLIAEIAIFNGALMRQIALPLGVMGATGMLLAVYAFRRTRTVAPSGEVSAPAFDNPFSLKSAIAFALVFAVILSATRLATTYLGDAWLPLVAIVSGLTDADAIAFSVSNLQRQGLISLDWAAFNLVLGAISNTFMKLFLVFSLGNRELFRQLLRYFLVIGAVGIVSMLLYYDLGLFARA